MNLGLFVFRKGKPMKYFTRRIISDRLFRTLLKFIRST